MDSKTVNVGFGNFVLAKRVVAVISAVSNPMRRLKEEAKAEGRLIDATHGRKTRSFIITDSNHLILSYYSTDTITLRLEALSEEEK